MMKGTETKELERKEENPEKEKLMNNGRKEGRKEIRKERKEDGARNEVHICVLVNRRK